MNIVSVEEKHLHEIAMIADEMYRQEMQQLGREIATESKDLEQSLKEMINDHNGLVCLEHEKVVGFLFYYQWENDDIRFCHSPFWGYGAKEPDRTKIMSKMFQTLADRMTSLNKKVHFSMNVYAHDEEIIRLYSFLQFGIQCEEGICSTQKVIMKKDSNRLDNVLITEYAKADIVKRWKEIWFLLSELIDHLKRSPIYYEGSEFTEGMYRDYLLDCNTRLFLAEKGQQAIGLMTVGLEGNSFFTNQKEFRNVGDVYVKKGYRGTGLAQRLLSDIAKTLYSENIETMWVEHGTANPNARGFWNKYFEAYTYTMIRDITKVE